MQIRFFAEVPVYCANCGSANSAGAQQCAKCAKPLSVRPSTMVGVAPQGGLISVPPAEADPSAATTMDPNVFGVAQAAIRAQTAADASPEPAPAPAIAPAPIAPARAAKGTMLGMGTFATPVAAAPSIPASASASAPLSSPSVASSKRIGGTQGLVIPAGAMINSKRVPGGYPAGAAKPSGIHAKRAPGLVVLLGVVTLGVYYLYWLNTVAQQLCEARGEDVPNPVKLVLLTMATLGIYGWIWRAGDAGQQIADAQARAGVSPVTDLGVVALIPFYGVYAMQRELNLLA